MTILILLVFSLSAIPARASIIQKNVTVEVTEIGISYFKVSGTISNISTYIGKGFQYRVLGSLTWTYDVPVTSKLFAATINGTLGKTYEVRAYCKVNKTETVYSKTAQVKIHTDPRFLVTPTENMCHTSDDMGCLVIEFVLDITPNGNTINQITVSVNGPILSEAKSLPGVPYTLRYKNLQYGIYNFEFRCVTDTGTYTSLFAVITSRLTPLPTPSPTPTPKPTATPTPKPTATPTPKPTATPTATPTPQPSPTAVSTPTTGETSEAKSTSTNQESTVTSTASAELVTATPMPTVSPNVTPTAQADQTDEAGNNPNNTLMLVILGAIAAGLVGISILLIVKRVKK